MKATSRKGNEYPMSTDFFVPQGDYATLFGEKYGEKPSQLTIMFYSDREVDCCDERWEIRTHEGKLYAYGDGETFYVYSKEHQNYSLCRTKENDPQIMDKIATYLHKNLTENQKKAVKWHQVLYLRFFIADFPVLGYWQFYTRAAKTSIPAIRETFDRIKESVGTVQGIPFLLTVTKHKSNRPDSTDQYPIVKLIPKLSVEETYQLIERNQKIGQSVGKLLQPAPRVENQPVYIASVQDDPGQDDYIEDTQVE